MDIRGLLLIHNSILRNRFVQKTEWPRLREFSSNFFPEREKMGKIVVIEGRKEFHLGWNAATQNPQFPKCISAVQFSV